MKGACACGPACCLRSPASTGCRAFGTPRRRPRVSGKLVLAPCRGCSHGMTVLPAADCLARSPAGVVRAAPCPRAGGTTGAISATARGHRSAPLACRFNWAGGKAACSGLQRPCSTSGPRLPSEVSERPSC